MTQTHDNLLRGLEAAGRRATPQRQAICRALVEHGGHPTAAEILERVRAHFPMISQATVYNTLDTLCELGLVQQLDVAGDEHGHYDLNLHPHLNIVCVRCGRIADMFTDTLDALLIQAEQRSGYDLDRGRLLIYGRCPSCQNTAVSVGTTR